MALPMVPAVTPAAPAMLQLAFPAIDPVLVEIGPFALRWYALAYVAGLLIGWRHARFLAPGSPAAIEGRQLDDFLAWALLGILIGGRLGYALFYRPGHFLEYPLEVLQVWRGGMSFHGGLVGMAAALLLFSRRRGLPPLALADIVACAAPIGLFLGRIANFINGEVYGRVSDLPWAMVFPGAGDLPRHPSQLYEALLEGVALFVAVNLLWRMTALRARPGAIAGAFLAGYGVARMAVEFVRQPDEHLGFVLAGLTMGQWLSLPMAIAGFCLLRWAPVPGARAGKRS